jgi:hypothetical protein
MSLRCALPCHIRFVSSAMLWGALLKGGSASSVELEKYGVAVLEAR